MTVWQTEVVDWLAIEKGTGAIILVVADDGDWENENDHLFALQEKLNSYLVFIESGQVFEQCLELFARELARDTSIKVRIMAKYPLSSKARRFFEHAKEKLDEAGVSLEHKVFQTPD